MAVFDINTGRGSTLHLQSLGNRIVVFLLGAWPGMALGLWPFWNQLPRAMGRFGYAFWWALPVAVVGGLLYTRIRHNRINQTVRLMESAEEAARKEAAEAAENAPATDPFEVPFSGLVLGTSFGFLRNERGYANGILAGHEVHLNREDACKNLIIFGGIGSGKTTRAINPLLKQILRQDTGALIFDIKTDLEDAVKAISAKAGRSYKVVGDGGMTLNLFRGCTPELASSYLKSCFLANGQGSGDSAFWVDSATEMSRHCLHLIRLAKGDSSLAGLYEVVFNDQARGDMLAQVAQDVAKLSDRDQRFFQQTQSFLVQQWDTRDEKLKSNTNATISQVLSPFTHPDLADAFSAGSEHGEADMTALINDGDVFLVKLPMTKYGMEGARFSYLILKLRFMNMMRERTTRPEWNQERAVAFICDEYQAIIDPISDTDFWDKSRSTGTVGVISMQGVSSLIQALKGNNQAANAILQNFRQRLIFRTEDEATVNNVQKVLGQGKMKLQSKNSGESLSNNFSAAPGSPAGSKSWSESESRGASLSKTWRNLFEAADMRQLSANECLFVGNLGDYGVAEVLQVTPHYVPKNAARDQAETIVEFEDDHA